MSKKTILLTFVLFLISNTHVFSEIIKDIKILGNERIPSETIIMFAKVKKNDEITDAKANSIIKDLYDSNFFEDISVKFDNNILVISVKEQPIIKNIILDGIKAKKFEEAIRSKFILKPRSSYNEFLISEEEKQIKSTLKKLPLTSSSVEPPKLMACNVRDSSLCLVSTSCLTLSYFADVAPSSTISSFPYSSLNRTSSSL
mgnify:CR=1 FL=1